MNKESNETSVIYTAGMVCGLAMRFPAADYLAASKAKDLLPEYRRACAAIARMLKAAKLAEAAALRERSRT